ncbi:ALF repeat-containing protein [Streptodolium elevatio]
MPCSTGIRREKCALRAVRGSPRTNPGRSSWIWAADEDERARATCLAADSETPAVRTAAEQALHADAAAIHTFLTTGQHQAAANDYRVRVVQIMDGAGRGVREAGQKALVRTQRHSKIYIYLCRGTVLRTAGPKAGAASRPAAGPGPGRLRRGTAGVGSCNARLAAAIGLAVPVAPNQLVTR